MNNVTVNVKNYGEFSVVKYTTYLDLIKTVMKDNFEDVILVKKGNSLCELIDFIDVDMEIEFLTYSHEEGARVYARSLSFLMLSSLNDIYGKDISFSIEHSLNSNFYCEASPKSFKIDDDFIEKLKNRMNEIVQGKISIEKIPMSRSSAIEKSFSQGLWEKADLLKYRRSSSINMYKINEYYNYFFGYMVPNTSYIKKFDIVKFENGFLLVMPNKNNLNTFNDYTNLDKISKVFLEQLEWCDLMGVRNIAKLNDLITVEKFKELVLINEGLHEKKIAEIADEISKRKNHVKLILIAGPSSSGKTTFAQRLCIQLRVNGIKPHIIGMDDYFINREFTPVDSLGKPDFESINAIDVEQFNEDLNRIINGEKVEIPHYNFITGKREYKGNFISLEKDEIIIVEGIHGLNNSLTEHIAPEHKFKIFISALTQLNIDEHNRVSTSDSRLIRRIVRDNRFRGNDAQKTLDGWASVRRGEELNIFPYQENADVVFNSATIYELCVLKPYIEPLLFKIDKSMPEYITAKRIIKFLEYFLPVNSDCVPNNSIIKEFLGGSVFTV